jgi:hypothetical protein
VACRDADLFKEVYGRFTAIFTWAKFAKVEKYTNYVLFAAKRQLDDVDTVKRGLAQLAQWDTTGMGLRSLLEELVVLPPAPVSPPPSATASPPAPKQHHKKKKKNRRK